MKLIASTLACGLIGIIIAGDAHGRGFGGFGGVRAGGYSGGVGGYRSESFGGYSGGGYSGYRSGSSYSGFRGGYGATDSYDRSWSGAGGASVNVSGERGAAVGPWGGMAAGSSRDISATTAGGRTFSADRDRGVAVGPGGRAVGGSSGSALATGPRGAVGGDWQSAFAGTRMSTDLGLGHYSTFNAAGVGHSTAFWSNSTMTNRASFVRSGFGYYNCFRPGWYARYPGSWYAAGWDAGAAWTAASYATVASFCSYPAAPIDYDYGSTVVFQNNDVYVNGQQTATAQQYSQQATTIADQGQQANATPEQEWKALGVFALVEGDETTSNNIFQLAVNKDGIIRGNYYDGLLDSTTPVFGSIDGKTQRAAWTIGKKNDRVFDAGVYNLTQGQAPVLVHTGDDRTQQMLLVTVRQPSSPPSDPYSAVDGQ